MLIEGVLLCPDATCQREYPVVDGIPLIVANLRELVADNLFQLMMRDDLSETLESILGDCSGPASYFDGTRHQLSCYARDHYGLHDPAEPATGASPWRGDAGLEPRLNLAATWPDGPVVDLGCSVGGTTFALAERTGRMVLGIDLNIAMLRIASHALLRREVRYPRKRTGVVYDRRQLSGELPARRERRLLGLRCRRAALRPRNLRPRLRPQPHQLRAGSPRDAGRGSPGSLCPAPRRSSPLPTMVPPPPPPSKPGSGTLPAGRCPRGRRNGPTRASRGCRLRKAPGNYPWVAPRVGDPRRALACAPPRPEHCRVRGASRGGAQGGGETTRQPGRCPDVLSRAGIAVVLMMMMVTRNVVDALAPPVNRLPMKCVAANPRPRVTPPPAPPTVSRPNLQQCARSPGEISARKGARPELCLDDAHVDLNSTVIKRSG